VARLGAIAQESDREAAVVARLWAAHHLENSGDPMGAIAQADQALTLVRDADGPWIAAMLHTMVATLHSQLGNSEEAVRHARAALPVLDRLDAADDGAQTRALLAVHAMSVGRLDEAEQWLAEIQRTRRSNDFGGASLAAARAEMALARGQVAEGLALYRAAVDELKAIRFPGMGDATGLEPWALFGESLGVTALAVHGTTPEDAAEGGDLYLALLAKALLVLDPQRPFMDYPVAGLVLHGLGAWGLLRDAMPADTAVQLLVLAERFGYTRFAPTMSPQRTEGTAEERAPGVAARLRRDYSQRTVPSLLPEARAAISRVPA
jgi:tetratricopeptide (TPR) repeat protein